MEQIAFFVGAIGALGGAIAVVSLKNPFYSVLALVIHLVFLAGIFLLLMAQFLAAGLIVVYAGAVMASPTVDEAAAQAVVADLGTKNYWLVPLSATTNPYTAPSTAAPYTGTAYQSKHVGDRSDTSPYDPMDPPLDGSYTPQPKALGISTTGFISNLGKLVAYVAPVKAP